jgi:alkylation response protein AidB-like acyl-CoA dehydrogenase
MWITSAGFADVFIVFAKFEGIRTSRHLLWKNRTVSPCGEPNKLGIKGSDTRQVFFNDCTIRLKTCFLTVKNGFKIAVNI